MTPEQLARLDAQGASNANWETPKISIIERVVHFLRRNK